MLNASLLDSEYSLTEVRVLFEITYQSATSLTALREVLGIDSCYLSRILTRFKKEKVIQATLSQQDGRRQILTVTKKGRSLMAELDERASAQIRQISSLLVQAASAGPSTRGAALAATSAAPSGSRWLPVIMRH